MTTFWSVTVTRTAQNSVQPGVRENFVKLRDVQPIPLLMFSQVSSVHREPATDDRPEDQ